MQQSEHGKACCILMQQERSYSFTELADMPAVSGEHIRNATGEIRWYIEKYCNRRVANRLNFLSVDRRLRNTGTSTETQLEH
jgi:hypothetical protein